MSRILVIDDEPIIRERLAQLLTLDGFTVLAAEGGADGLEVFAAQRPEVSLVDIKMPGVGGIEVLKAIRAGDPDAEVIMITGHGGNDTIIQALNEGAFGYVQKPIEYDELLIMIRKALEKIALRRQLQEYVIHLEEAISEKSRELDLRIRIQKTLQQNIEQAKEYQKKLVTIRSPRIWNLRFHYDYIPYDKVGGDILNVIRVNERTVIFYLADIVGHGVAAAIFSTFVKVHIDRWVRCCGITSPLAIVGRLRDVLVDQNITTESMLAVFIGRLDTENLLLTYVNAGQFRPMLVGGGGGAGDGADADGNPEEPCQLPGAAAVLCDVLNDPLRAESVCQLEEGSRLLVFSDGLIERTDDHGEVIGTRGLCDFFRRHRLTPAELRRFIGQFSMKDQGDDISYILLDASRRLRREVPDDLAGTEEALAEVEAELLDRYPDTPQIVRVLQCYDELMRNAIEHGHRGLPGKTIATEIEFERGRVRLRVRDRGEGFDWRKLPPDRPDVAAARGRGLYLVKRFSTSLSFNEAGNEVVAEVPVVTDDSPGVSASPS